MDSVSSQAVVEFRYENLSCAVPVLTDPWETYLRITASFDLRLSGCSVYSEQFFPIVEFAIQSQLWSRRAANREEDFVYTSIDAEEEGLVWIRRVDGRWRIGAFFQRHDAPELLTQEEIRAALDRFYDRLRSDVMSMFHVDLESLFTWNGLPTRQA